MTVTFTSYFCEQTGAITSSSGPFIEQVSPTTVIPKEQSVSSPIPMHSTHLLQEGPKPFTTKILYSLSMFDVFL